MRSRLLTTTTTLLSIFLATVWAGDAEQIVQAGIDAHAKAAYFVSSGYVFALNVAENGDVYYHMNAPASHSWMGVGFGSSMTNTRMLISYISADGHTLTNTVRYSSGHSEPVAEDVPIEPVTTDVYAPFHNTLSPDGIMIAHSVCRNCSTWRNGGALNLTDTAAPFIFALGPNVTLRSDDKNAPLKLHSFHGSFQLDMTVATNSTGDYGRVPAPQDPGLQVGDGFWAFANYYSSTVYDTGTDAEWAGVAHAAFMGLTFLLIFPLGAISLRLMRRAFVHAVAQCIGVGFLLIGFGLGIYASKLYNKSKSLTSSHQLLGLLLFTTIFLQLGLGLTHHLLYLRFGIPTLAGKIHRYLGLSIMILALINGFLGIRFAGGKMLPYGIVVAVVVLLFGGVWVGLWRHGRRGVYRPEKEGFINPGFSGSGSGGGGGRGRYTDGEESGREFEMSEVPFAGSTTNNKTTKIKTPRTPFFMTGKSKKKWGVRLQEEDGEVEEEDKRREHHLAKKNGGAAVKVQEESLYADSPAEERGEFFPYGGKGKWEGVGGLR